MVFFFLAWIIIKKIFKTLTIPCGENALTRRLRGKVHYFMIIARFQLESCLDIGLSAMICILMRDEENFSTFWEGLSTFSAYFSLLIFVIAPIIFLKLTTKHLKDVLKTGESPYMDVFEDYKLDYRAMRYQTIFFLRRYTIIAILTSIPKFGALQAFGQILSTLYIACYLAEVRPYTST